MIGLKECKEVDEFAAGLIRDGMAGPTVETGDDVIKAVSRGNLSVWDVFEDGYRFGVIVLGYENGGKLLNIVCAGSAVAEIDTVKSVLPGLCEFAKTVGCQAVRFQTARAGLVQKATGQGFEVVGTVMEKKL